MSAHSHEADNSGLLVVQERHCTRHTFADTVHKARMLLCCPLVLFPAGGWSHLDQLFGLMKGSHTLLSAQKVPNSTSHLIMRLLQQVAAAAGAVGFNLDTLCNIPESQAEQDREVLSSQEEPASHHGTTYLSIMLDVSDLGLPQAHMTTSCSLCMGQCQLPLMLQPSRTYLGLVK